MNKEIDINKFNKSITFQNRGIGFTQIGIAGEILDLIDDLQQENKRLKDNWNKLKEYCKENTLCYEVGDDENTKLIGSKIHGLNVLDKMQELEGSDNNGI